jgi:hypothetical protein
VDDKLHAAGLIEKALGNDSVLSWNRAQHGAPSEDVFHRLLGPGIIQPALLLQPRYGGRCRGGPCGRLCQRRHCRALGSHKGCPYSSVQMGCYQITNLLAYL